MVDMFNAPDISGDGIKGLPFGYFITRLVATAQKNHDEIWAALLKLIMSHFDVISSKQQLLKQQRGQGKKRFIFGSIDFSLDEWYDGLREELLRTAGKWLIEAIIDLLIDYAGIYDSSFGTSSKIILPDMTTVTVGDVKNRYHTLLLKWYQKLGDLTDLYRSALASENLAWHAKKLLQSGPAKLVVMGHTHAGKSLLRLEGQYANSGCWVAEKQPTYVEIDTAASPKAVVKAWPDNILLAPSIAWASPAIMAAPSPPMSDEAAWEEEPLPQFWQEGSDLDK